MLDLWVGDYLYLLPLPVSPHDMDERTQTWTKQSQDTDRSRWSLGHDEEIENEAATAEHGWIEHCSLLTNTTLKMYKLQTVLVLLLLSVTINGLLCDLTDISLTVFRNKHHSHHRHRRRHHRRHYITLIIFYHILRGYWPAVLTVSTARHGASCTAALSRNQRPTYSHHHHHHHHHHLSHLVHQAFESNATGVTPIKKYKAKSFLSHTGPQCSANLTARHQLIPWVKISRSIKLLRVLYIIQLLNINWEILTDRYIIYVRR